MAPMNWANSDADIEANLKWIEDRHQLSGLQYEACPNPHCSGGWHGLPKGNPEKAAEHQSGYYDSYCPGSPTFNTLATDP